MSMNILFTCAGRRNYLINYFKEALQGEGLVIAADAQNNAPALIDADRAAILPDIFNDNYIEALLDLCEREKVKAIISLNDLELPILAAHQMVFKKIGTQILVSNSNVIDLACDKWDSAQFIKKIGLNSPKSYLTVEDARKALSDKSLSFPLVLKPRQGSASAGLDFPENMEELELSYKLLQMKLRRSALNQARGSDLDRPIIIQEKLAGEEYGMDILNDFKGSFVDAYARMKLAMRSGETDKAVSIIDPRFTAAGKKIGENLGHIGSLDCDLILQNGELYVLDLNPRFGGGYPFSHEAGANIAAIYVEWLKGNTNIKAFCQYQEGLSFSKCDRLIKVPDLR